MIAMASAPPSTGSVPAPASSSSTSAGVSSARVHGDDVGDVAGERAQALRDRLLVADVGEYRLEHRDLRILGDGDEQAGLRHQRQQPRRLQRDGLAAGVRPGDHQDVHRRNQRDVDGNRLGVGAVVLTLARPHRSAAVASGPSAGSDAPPGSAADGGRRAARAGRPSRASARRRAPGSRTAPAHAARRVRRRRRPSDRRSSARPRNASVSASRMRRTSSCSCCSSATMSLLISTVLSGSRKRLAPLPELPCTMPGIDARCSARTTST